MSAAYVQLVVQLGAAGVLFWLIYQLFTKTIPKMQTDFRASLREEIDAFRDEMRLERDAHSSEIVRLIATQERIRERIHDLANVIQGRVEITDPATGKKVQPR